jgi:uncharacterized protein DUF397
VNTDKSEPWTATLDGHWIKSSYSAGSGPDCVEIMRIAGGFAVRDSKNAAGPRLRLPDAAWAAFLAGVR